MDPRFVPEKLDQRDMLCKYCIHKIIDKDGICEEYPKMKPYRVLHGGDCLKFEKG